MISQAEAVRIFVNAFRGSSASLVVGTGQDDIGVFLAGQKLIGVTTDFVNFRPLVMSLRAGDLSDLGRLLVFQNVSDLLGSGVEPLALTIAVGITKDFTAEDIELLANGIANGAELCDVAIIGGDTKEAPVLVLNATAFGIAGPGGPWLMTAARPGDALFLSGPVGGVMSAVYHLSRDPRDRRIDSAAKTLLVAPQLPIVLAKRLRELAVVAAGTDISDGLGADLEKLLNASRVGARVFAERIPLPASAAVIAKEYELSPMSLAFGLGGDGQFLLAASGRDAEKAVEAGAIEIGVITDSQKELVLHDGSVQLPTFGHRDFSGRDLVSEALGRFGE